MLAPRCHVLLFLVLFTGYTESVLGLGGDVTDLKRLRSDLLTGYDKNARPSIYHNNSTLVQINPYYRTFEMDEVRSMLTLHCWTVMSWTDEHLKWDQKAYGNISKIHFAAHEIWQPDLGVYNNLDQSEIDHFGNTRLIVWFTGRVVWVPPTRFQVACPTDVRRWPYDTQTCYIVIGSWAHDGGQLDLTIPVNQTQMTNGEVMQNREWELMSNYIDARKYVYGGIPYPDVLITLNIRRKSNTHTAAIVVPALAISFAILITFWLRPGSTERLAIIMLVIMINAIYLYNIYIRVPNNGNSVPLILLFYRDSLLMVSVALIWTIILRYLAATKRTSPVPLPSFIISFLESFPAKIMCLDPRPTASTTTSNNVDDEGKLISGNSPYQADWAWLAHLLDRVAFMIYLIVYITFYAALL